MSDRINRREFIERGTGAALGMSLALGGPARAAARGREPVRIGVVGTGGRG